MARSAAPKQTRNATASKRLSKKVSGKPFPLQMLLLWFSLRRPNHTTSIPHGPRAEGPSCEGWKLMHRQGCRNFDRGDAVLDRLLHLLERAHLDLAHALA